MRVLFGQGDMPEAAFDPAAIAVVHAVLAEIRGLTPDVARD
jgi:hypothetical protein